VIEAEIDRPELVFFSTKNILPEQELLYDYKETDRQILSNYSWLKS
jgi:hypothetical protein